MAKTTKDGYGVPAPPPHLHQQGACHQAKADPRMFFPDRGDGGDARAICRRCTVADDCLAYAMRHAAVIGIWGGTDETDRRRARERNKKRAWKLAQGGAR